MAEETLFEKIARGAIPSQEVLSDEEFYAFRDIHPAAPVHVLIIPRKPIPTLLDATEADEGLLGRLLLFANKVAIKEGLAESGFRLALNCGRDACQEVQHIHFHLLGGRPLSWPPG